jgi:hypothetical protein
MFGHLTTSQSYNSMQQMVQIVLYTQTQENIYIKSLWINYYGGSL